jgi:hypothetical protein
MSLFDVPIVSYFEGGKQNCNEDLDPGEPRWKKNLNLNILSKLHRELLSSKNKI